MGISPTYVPVIRNGTNVEFADVVVTGTLDVAGATALAGDLTGTNASFTGTFEADGIATFNGQINAGVIAPTLVSVVTGGNAVRVFQAGDAQPRLNVDQAGVIAWGPGGVTPVDTTLNRSGVAALSTPGFFAMGSGQSSGGFSIFTGASNGLRLGTAGGGIAIAEGANARQGVATLVGGTIAVANTSVTANTRVQLTRSTAGGALGHLSYTIAAGVGFTVTSSSGTDTSGLVWHLYEPA